jgi:hypothetical protein
MNPQCTVDGEKENTTPSRRDATAAWRRPARPGHRPQALPCERVTVTDRGPAAAAAAAAGVGEAKP